MKRQNIFITYSLIFLVMGLVLPFPVESQGTVPTDSTTKQYFTPTNTNIQCKTVTIDNSTAHTVTPYNGIGNPASPCPEGEVPIGLNNGNLNISQTSHTNNDWVSDTTPGSGIAYNIYTIPLSSTMSYLNGSALNQVQMICAKRTIAFTSGPCTK